MFAVFRKEWKSYFSGMFGYTVTAVLLFFAAAFLIIFHLFMGLTEFSLSLIGLQWVLIPLLPCLAMYSFAQERQRRTDKLLASLPLRLRDILFGKYFALIALLLVPIGVIALYPLLLATAGNLSLLSAYVALFGFFLSAAALLSLCTYVSSLVKRPLLAAAISFGVLLLLFLSEFLLPILPKAPLFSFLLYLVAAIGVSVWFFRRSRSTLSALLCAAVLILPACLLYFVRASAFSGLFAKLLERINPFLRLGGFSYGYLDLGSLLFYLSFITFFLFLTAQSIQKQRHA